MKDKNCLSRNSMGLEERVFRLLGQEWLLRLLADMIDSEDFALAERAVLLLMAMGAGKEAVQKAVGLPRMATLAVHCKLRMGAEGLPEEWRDN